MIFFDKYVHSFMSCTTITLKFKMCLFILPPLMPDEDNNFGGPLGLDFTK